MTKCYKSINENIWLLKYRLYVVIALSLYLHKKKKFFSLFNFINTTT